LPLVRERFDTERTNQIKNELEAGMFGLTGVLSTDLEFEGLGSGLIAATR
jgi:hypothetical protein